MPDLKNHNEQDVSKALHRILLSDSRYESSLIKGLFNSVNKWRHHFLGGVQTPPPSLKRLNVERNNYFFCSDAPSMFRYDILPLKCIKKWGLPLKQ